MLSSILVRSVAWKTLETTCQSVWDIHWAFTHHYWMMLTIVATARNTHRRQNPPSWKYMGTSQTPSRRSDHHLWKQICGSTLRGWMPRKARSSVREGFESSSGLSRDHHNATWCPAVAVSWYAVGPLWNSVPCQSRGPNTSWPWLFPKEMFNSDRYWLYCWHSCGLQVVSQQVTCFLGWARSQSSFLPSWASPSEV